HDHPAIVLDPGVALVTTAASDVRPLPLYAPTRDLFLAFTRERSPGTRTRYRLKTAGLPWIVSLLTVGVLDLAITEIKAETVPTTEEERARAAPKATRLAELVSPPHGCADGRSPCDRYYVIPRPRDDVPLQLHVDVELHDPFLSGLRLVWSAPLPPGKPLAARLHDLFRDGPIALDSAHIEPAYLSPPEPEHCRLREPRCTTPTAARTAVALPTLPPIAAPERLATPAESLAARPPWRDDDSYAPGTTLYDVTPAELLAGGELRDALLVCDLKVPGDPQHTVLEVQIGAQPRHRPGVYMQENRARFVVPLVQLAPGDTLTIAATERIRRWLWGPLTTALGQLALTYRGTLPLAQNNRKFSVSCGALGRDALEARVTRRIDALAEALTNFDIGVDPIHESSPDWGLGAWGMNALRRRVEDVAGLVGWSDPRIAALLPALDHYHAVFQRHVQRFLAATREQQPPPGTQLSLKKGDLRVVGPACGAALDRRRILWWPEKVPSDGCVTIVEVTNRGPKPLETSPRTGSLGAAWKLELVWADGRRSDAWAVGVELLGGSQRDLEHPALAAGESIRFYLAPEQPFHREGQPGPLFLLALDSLDRVYIRLQ
ncbi:MAG TPA: hypothetical protein VIK91_06285, partial [Nannocystis sp.]